MTPGEFALAAAFLSGAVLGFGGGWLLLHRQRQSAVAGGVGSHLLPDPALHWLRRSHHALGVWVAELDAEAAEPHAERVLDAERLSVTQIAGIDRRIERARDQEQQGAERVDGGTLVFRASRGVAVALLLADGHESEALGTAEADLDQLLDGMRRRPQMVALAQSHGAQLESVESVALRLAYQLERITGAEVVVGVAEAPGVRVVGVSGSADARLRDTIAAADSDLARVATGVTAEELTVADPLGGLVADRRRRGVAVRVLPLTALGHPVGAVALWPAEGREVAGAMMAEVREAIANAAPRLAQAVQTDELRERTLVDTLTGLLNRRALEQALQRVGAEEGALVYCDFDRFKTLNDTLGHPAGDAALAHFARLIREQIRGRDVAARIGGDEFAIWLPDASLDLACRVAERVRVKLGTTAWDWQGRQWPLSASFGVAATPETSRRRENLPAQADAALYVAKNSGRNRVEAAGRT